MDWKIKTTDIKITPPQKKQRKRERYVDIGKGLAMIAIVCGHICSKWFPIWLTSFWPVAFFFVVAGFYIKEESLLKPVRFILHKLKTIYLPGTVIYILAVLLHNPLCKMGIYPIGLEHPMTHQAFELWDGKRYIIQIAKTVVAPNGELAMGAMWFLYALFFALCFLSIIAFVAKKISNEKLTSNKVMLVSTILISTVSIGLSVYGINIPRISNALTIIFFIYGGLMIKQRFKSGFDNWGLLIVSLLLYMSCVFQPHEHMSFPVNRFPDLILPFVLSVAAVYGVLYLSKFIERTKLISKVLCYIGENSLYIMALHIFGFFICTKLLNQIGTGEGLIMAKTLYTYDVGSNIWLTLTYLLFGIVFPLLALYCYKQAKRTIINVVKQIGSTGFSVS